MVTYNVNFTDDTEEPIGIEERAVDNSLPITLFGRRKLEYGEEMNENILHLLENFACPEQTINGVGQGVPDLTVALEHTLANAIDGQLWYNSTQKVLYTRTGGVWVPLGHLGEVASNYGTILGDGGIDNSQLPLPVSDTGYEFTYDECSWLVSPRTYDGVTAGMVCETDENAIVTHTYNIDGSPVVGVVNYMIIGIRDAAVQAPNVPVSPSPLPPTPTPTLTETLIPPPTAPPTIDAIIWDGGTITNALSSADYVGNLLRFRSDAGTGPAGQANMEYWNVTPLFEGWLDYTPVNDGVLVMKVELEASTNIGNSNLIIIDNAGMSYDLENVNDVTAEFDANEAQIMIDNSSLASGESASVDLTISISYDGDDWVDRLVELSVAKV